VASQDRFQRVTNLLLLLLATPRPLTLDEIAAQVAGYPDGHVARRQAFERDKRLLREEGVEIATLSVPGPSQQGYRVDPDHYYLPSVALSTDERLALALALAAVRVDDRSGQETALEMGVEAAIESDAIAVLETAEGLERLDEAIRTDRRVRFEHQGRTRRLDPWAIVFRWGRWYVTGWDPDREAARTFRVDRITSVEVSAEPRAPSPPPGRAAGLVPRHFWQAPPQARGTSVVLALAPEVAESVWDDLGLGAPPPFERPETVATLGGSGAPRADGTAWVETEVAVGDFELFLSWLFELGDRAVVLSPAELRSAAIGWLEGVVAGASDVGPGEQAPAEAGEGRIGSGREEPRRPAAGGAGPLGALDAQRRLHLALRLVPWVVRRGRVSLDEAAAVAGLGREQVQELLLSVACCGLPPYTPDTLVELIVDEEAGTVEARLGQGLERPPRLGARDALRLGAAARAVLAIEGTDPDGVLARALAKVEATLGDRALSVELDRPRWLGELQAALEEGGAVEIDYDSLSHDEVSRRVVEPWRVQAVRGRWYLDAWCRSAGALRRFRVDRVRVVRRVPVGERLGPVDPARRAVLLEELDAWTPEGRLAAVELPVGRSRLVDALPGARFEPGPPGRLLVRLPVRSVSWFGLLLVRIGPEARVLEPADLRGAGAAVARAMLRRYEDVRGT